MALVSSLLRDDFRAEGGVSSGRFVYGAACAVDVRNIAKGDSTRPSFSYAEQICYILKGRVRVFVLDFDDAAHGQELEEGAFFRIPQQVIFWIRSLGPEAAKVAAFSAFSGLRVGHPGPEGNHILAASWERPEQILTGEATLYPVSPDRYPAIANEESALRRGLHGLARDADNVPVAELTFTKRKVFGRGATLMMTTRSGVYHSKPHIHAAEQINLVSRGEIRGFRVGPDGKNGDAVIGETGDVTRTPIMAPHWAWGLGGECDMIEFHVPGVRVYHSVSLISGNDRFESEHGAVRNIFLDPDFVDADKIESGELTRG